MNEHVKKLKEERKRKNDAYIKMSPQEKIQYNCDEIEELLKKELGNLSCGVGRSFCIECGLQEIRNNLKKLQAKN